MLRRLVRAAAMAAVALATIVGGSVAGPVDASAAPPPGVCWGDWCSGLNPYTTRAANGRTCGDGAYPVASVNSFYSDTRYRLHLMWSPHCASNFAAWSGPVGPSALLARQNTGYTQSAILGGGGWWYTPMIYSPYNAVYARGCLQNHGCIQTAWA